MTNVRGSALSGTWKREFGTYRRAAYFARLAPPAPQSWSAGLSSESVACSDEVVLAVLRTEEIAGFTDGAPEGVDGSHGAGSQKGFQLCKMDGVIPDGAKLKAA